MVSMASYASLNNSGGGPNLPSHMSGSPSQRLTSFNFLPPEEDRQTNQYGFGGLFSRVREAFGASSSEPHNSIASDHRSPDRVATAASSSSNILARPTSPHRKSPERLASQPSTSSPSLSRTPRGRTSPIQEHTINAPHRTTAKQPHSKLPSVTSIKPFPHSIKPTRAAPALVSTAPTNATAYSSNQPDPQNDVDDSRSIFADTINEYDDHPGNHSIGMSRATTLHGHDQTTLWNFIPGFPLSRDLLADDTQSIHTSPSKAGEEFRVGRTSPTASFQTSAEAFRRLTIKGGAASSKQFWMPDDLAKECSACGTAFSLARRKHHCRCCGQIFCFKCASNLLAGSTFNLQGMVRVCDFCTKMVTEYQRARSGMPHEPSKEDNRTTDGRVRADMISAPLEATVENAPQGRFAANALFSATADELEVVANRTLQALGPIFAGDDGTSGLGIGSSDLAPVASQAPFRRCLADEDQFPAAETGSEGLPSPAIEEDLEALANEGQTPGLSAHPSTPSPLATSSIAFPSSSSTTSPAKNLAKTALDEARAKLSHATLSHDTRSRLVSDASVRAFRRSRLRSRLNTNDFAGEKSHLSGIRDDLPDSRPGSRLGNTTQALQADSLAYLRRLMEQCIDRGEIARRDLWLEVLLPLALKVIANVKPNVYGQGRMMGLRKYVKIKRIPGGTPQDCSLLNGYICSHNVASKAMLRKLPLHSARVALVSFALTAIRGEGHYTSLDNLSASEREYTRILVARITALRPHLLVVKSQVSRLALEMLEAAGIVVVWNVPNSSMEAIARVTQSDIITSVDRLALSPRLGRCGSFAVNTYHSALLQGKKRSFLQFTGTPKDLGCSVILRGGGRALLGKIKSILELSLLTAHNLRLEEAMRDTDILSILPEPNVQGNSKIEQLLRDSDGDQTFCSPSIDGPVSAALRDYRHTLLSISAHVRIPPPYLLIKLQQERLALASLEKELEQQSQETTEELPSDHQPAEEEQAEETTAESTSSSPTIDPDETLGDDSIRTVRSASEETAKASPSEKDPIDEPLVIELDETDDVVGQCAAILPSREQMRIKTKRALVQARHAIDAKSVTSMTNYLTPFAHQKLTLLHAVVSTATRKPCVGPDIDNLEFYGLSDFTLGNYLEIKCQSTSKICHVKDCGLQEILHYDLFIHNDVRIQLFCERFVCPIAGQENSLLTWEYCKVCEAATPVSVVNEDAKSYSWAKLLEAHFYTAQTSSSCPHPNLPDRIRYFAYKNLAFRLHVEQIHPFEVVVPGLRLFVRPDTQSSLRSEEALGVARRADAYFHSVNARLKSLENEIGLGREGFAAIERHRPALRELADVAKKGRKDVNELMLSEIKASASTDTHFLSRVRRRLQEVVVTVDKLFAQLEKVALPKERDVRRLTSNHLSRIFAEREAEKPADITGLPTAAETDETSGDGLPLAQPESSVAALARLADTSGLGLPQFGLGFDILSPSETPSRTPSRAQMSKASSSRGGSVLPSPAPTPALPSSPPPPSNVSPGLPQPPKAVKAESNIDDSDGNSSPTTFVKAARPKPRRGQFRVDGSGAEESSCTEAGSLTDSQQVVSSLVSRFEIPKAEPLAPKPTRPAGLSHRSVSATAVPKAKAAVAASDGESRTRPPSRPTSPLAQRGRGPSSRVLAPRVRSGSLAADSGRKESLSTKAPPSSYRAPTGRQQSISSRPSESESEGPTSIAGRLRLTSGGPNLPSGPPTRPPLSRRNSGKSDTGNEATLRPQRRKASGQGSVRSHSRVPIPASDTRGRVSTIARHFDRINREAEKERDKQKRALALRARRALPPSASMARVAEYRSVTAAVESDESSDEENGRNASKSDDDGGEADSEDEEIRSTRRERFTTTSLSRQTSQGSIAGGFDSTVKKRKEDGDDGSTTIKMPSSPPPPEAAVTAVEKLLPHLREQTPATPSSDAERGSLLKTISSFWASRTGTSLPLLEYPLSAEQHLFADSPLLLREDEPSSVIAFTLVSHQYQHRMQLLRDGHPNTRGNKTTDANGSASIASDGMEKGTCADPNEAIEATLRMPEGVHLRFDYESGASRFHCRILFAEQFEALRRCCGCEESLVSSLARCVKWDSTGGKSGMTFLKTQDDRLVLKQLSSSELASFSTFAPHYFAHMAECLMHGKPTTLAKIFGLFRISVRNAATGRSFKLDVVVMENLFYGRKCSRIFDLKGSMRNRYVKETGAAGEVLLDENLVEISRKSPLYIREASKNMLKQALKHDSNFLAEMNIMDYSVIVGIDSNDPKSSPQPASKQATAESETDSDEHHELVVGIIDFLRSYTWDKRVETFVKEQSSLLAGGGAKGELPTVITPKQYAQRFVHFLDGVLLVSPDSWNIDVAGVNGLKDGQEEVK
ncbi:unnamed protein product [Sympodiomycopsis kandeliae]